jgi:hypothetical protein
MSYSEIEDEIKNTGSSFDEYLEEESIYDYYGDDLTDEERREIESSWLEQFDTDEKRLLEKERLEYYKKNHIDPNTGYAYVEGRKPHRWVEQDDGSWLCSLCGDTKEKKVDKKKSQSYNAINEAAAHQAALDLMRRNDEERRFSPDASFPQKAFSETKFHDDLVLDIQEITDRTNKNVGSVSGAKHVDALTDVLMGDTDVKMKNRTKFALDKAGVVRAKKYFQKQTCSLCSDDSEYNLAKYENWNGQKLCRQHLEELLQGDNNNETNDLHDVEKIIYGRVADIDPSRAISDPMMLNDMDKLFLQKRGKDSISSKIMEGSKSCESDTDLNSNLERCKEKAMYYAMYKNGSSRFLCKDHMEESFWRDGDDIRDILKVYVKQWEDHELPEEKQSSRNISVVNVDMDKVDDEGSILIPTGKIARELIYDRVMSSGEVPFLYRCSHDVAKIAGRGRYKIEDPRMISERVLGGKSGSDSRSGISVRHVVTGDDESAGSYYFNLPRVNKSKSKQIVSSREAKNLGVFYDYNIINDEVAKKIFQKFCKGELSPKQLDKTVTGGEGSMGNEKDFEFWDDIFPFESEGEWRHSRRRR